jgi:hypothetical protein
VRVEQRVARAGFDSGGGAPVALRQAYDVRRERGEDILVSR